MVTGDVNMVFRSRGYVVKLNGLPFRASEREVEDWLAEAADPVEVIIEMDRLAFVTFLLRYDSMNMIWLVRNGRPSGRADAVFASSREARRLVDLHCPPCGTQCEVINVTLLAFYQKNASWLSIYRSKSFTGLLRRCTGGILAIG